MYSRTASAHGGGLASSTPSHSAGPASSSSSRQKSQRPTGRVELLEWVNQVCGTRYPSIECLRDGLAYMTLVEATVSKTEPQLLAPVLSASSAKAGLPPLPRTAAARALIEKADYHVSLSETSSSHQSAALDPSLDTIQTKERCEKNFHILQAMLRGCLVDKSHGMEVDVKRLASGKLQEHMRLLQWSVGFVEQQFALADKAAVKRKQEQPPLQQSHARQSRAATRGGRAGGGGDSEGTAPTTIRASSSGGAPAAAQRHRDPTGVATMAPSTSSASAGGVGGDGAARRRTASASSTIQRNSNASTRNGSTLHSLSEPGVGLSDYDASSYSMPATVPSRTAAAANSGGGGSVDPALAALLMEVEALEAQVWTYTSSSAGQQPSGGVGSSHGANSLDDVRGLLRERDVLWQTLVAAEAAVWRATNEWQNHQYQQRRAELEEYDKFSDDDNNVARNRKTSSSSAPSALLRDLCSLFDVCIPLPIIE
jgi:hypothetical protein